MNTEQFKIASTEEVKASVREAMLSVFTAFAGQVAGANLGTACVGCAIVAAFAERNAIDPANVVKWADWMATNQAPGTAPEVSKAVASVLLTFSTLLKSMMPAATAIRAPRRKVRRGRAR